MICVYAQIMKTNRTETRPAPTGKLASDRNAFLAHARKVGFKSATDGRTLRSQPNAK